MVTAQTPDISVLPTHLYPRPEDGPISRGGLGSFSASSSTSPSTESPALAPPSSQEPPRAAAEVQFSSPGWHSQNSFVPKTRSFPSPSPPGDKPTPDARDRGSEDAGPPAAPQRFPRLPFSPSLGGGSRFCSKAPCSLSGDGSTAAVPPLLR